MIEDVESDDDFDDFDNATFEHESFMMTSVHNISVNQQGSSQKIPSSQYETQRSQRQASGERRRHSASLR